jgi:hypothetical protein
MKLLFTRERTLTSWLIRFVTWSTYSHVDLIINDQVYGAKAFKGVHFANLKDRLKEASSAEIMEIDFNFDDESILYDFINENLDKPYDWFGALSIGFKREWQANDKWFCSELIAVLLKKGGLKIFDDKFYGRITPQHLYFLNYKKVSIDV